MAIWFYLYARKDDGIKLQKMKILAITAHYPPYHFGGYELRIKNIMDELSHRGHEILVITSIKDTSSRGTNQAASYEIFRRLHVCLKNESFISRLTLNRASYLFGILLAFTRELFFDLLDIAFVDRQIQNFQPDIIYLGHTFILTRTLMPYFSTCIIPILYDEGGVGLIGSWEERGIWHRFVEEHISRYSIFNAIRPLIVKAVCTASAQRIKPKWDWPIKMEILFNSELNRRNTIARGVPVGQARVIHSGIDIKKFDYCQKNKPGSPLIFIVPGRFEPGKGQIDAVRLLATLREHGIDSNMVLVGEKWSDSFYLEIIKEINDLRLGDWITFLPMITQDKLVDLYHQADICFFPSYFRTGFSRIPLEAMACGCVVISYGNEGSDEIIRDKRNGFLVPPAEYGQITEVVKELIANPNTFTNVLDTARKEVADTYSLPRYVDQIEEFINCEVL